MIRRALFLLCLMTAGFVFATDESALAPPQYMYSPEQQGIIKKYGNPWEFNIVFQQVGKFRYETWIYGGTIKKKFGFVNGKKELEGAYMRPLAPASKTALTPKQFTLSTTTGNLRLMFGPPGKIIPGMVPNIKQESYTYSRRGLAVNFTKGKIVSVATIPPTK
jgi:hypothetical protein